MIANVYITPGCRTPIGTLGGALAEIPAHGLGSVVIRNAIERAGVEQTSIDEVIMGNVLTAGAGQNPARQAAMGADVPATANAMTIGKVCGSGLKAVMLAAQAIQCGDARVIVAGGMETMSQAPYLLPKARRGYRLGNDQLVDSLLNDGLIDAYDDHVQMGCFADRTAAECGIGRQRQDEFAAESYRRAIAAASNGAFDREIIPVSSGDQKRPVKISADEQPKKFNEEKMKTLRPVFSPDGTVTAANASGINDGAAAVVVFGEAARSGVSAQPIFKILGYSSASREPGRFTLAPIGAMTRLLDRLSMRVEDVDLFEINEAFAMVPLAAMGQLSIRHERVNVNGGAVALGHPIGASGARVLVTLMNAMIARGARTGIASLCIGGGEAVAAAVERL